MNNKLKVIGDILWLGFVVAGFGGSAWNHSSFIIFWLLLLCFVLISLVREYCNISFVENHTINNFAPTNTIATTRRDK